MRYFQNRYSTLFIGILFIGLIFALTDPVDFLMPTEVQTTILMIAVSVYGIFAGLVYKENPSDEREEHLLFRSSRAAFLSGTAVLIAGLVKGTLTHTLDPWLVWSLGTMVAVKVLWLYRNDMR